MKPIKTMRVLLTENCNANCPACFNKDLRTARHMDTEKAQLLFDQLSENIIKLKIMGGEPTVHPDFLELYKHAQSRFLSVRLFTNAINEKILEITPRINDGIVYNMILIKEGFDFNKLLPTHAFSRAFETMVSSDTDTDKLKEKISWTYGECKKLGIQKTIKFSVTLNCVENIFKKRDEINIKWTDIISHILKIGPELLYFDHTIPLCFWKEETARFIENNDLGKFFYRTCRPGDYGLINSSFELLHCNQHPVKLGKIFDNAQDPYKIMSYEKMNGLLLEENLRKFKKNMASAECRECKYAGKYCTGGCLKHKFI